MQRSDRHSRAGRAARSAIVRKEVETRRPTTRDMRWRLPPSRRLCHHRLQALNAPNKTRRRAPPSFWRLIVQGRGKRGDHAQTIPAESAVARQLLRFWGFVAKSVARSAEIAPDGPGKRWYTLK